MKNRIVRSVNFGLLLILGPAALAQFPLPAATPPNVPTSGLNVVAASGIELVAPNHARRDLGKIDMLDAHPLDARFTLRNDTKSTLVIERVQPTCGCTSAILGAPTADGSHRLAAGDTIDLDITVDPSHLNAGPIDKYINVFIKNEPSVAATIELTGSIGELITFSANRIDLGKTKYGMGVSVILTVRLDKRIAAQGLTLVSDNPDVKVLPAPGQPFTGDNSLTALRYSVILVPTAGIGFVHANVGYEPAKSAASHDQRLEALLRSKQAVVVGEVSGSFDLAPRIALFGTIPAGTRAVRKLAITGLSDVSKLTITSDRPYLSATAANANLNVAVAANAPTGPVEAHLTLTLPNGEHMTLPVFGYVTK